MPEPRREWTDDEIAKLKSLAGKMSIEEIAAGERPPKRRWRKREVRSPQNGGLFHFVFCPEALRQPRQLILVGRILHFGQGIPAPPQRQTCAPAKSWSGWFSQTQPSSSQNRQFT
jgi:hypothetical protein